MRGLRSCHHQFLIINYYENQEDQDWGIVAMVVDRMFLWVFGAAAVVSADNQNDDDGGEYDNHDENLSCGP